MLKHRCQGEEIVGAALFAVDGAADGFLVSLNGLGDCFVHRLLFGRHDVTCKYRLYYGTIV